MCIERERERDMLYVSYKLMAIIILTTNTKQEHTIIYDTIL